MDKYYIDEHSLFDHIHNRIHCDQIEEGISLLDRIYSSHIEIIVVWSLLFNPSDTLSFIYTCIKYRHQTTLDPLNTQPTK